MQKIDMPDWSHKPGGLNPLSGKDNGPYAEIVLGDLAELDQFGVRLERLPPDPDPRSGIGTSGKKSSSTWLPESSYWSRSRRSSCARAMPRAGKRVRRMRTALKNARPEARRSSSSEPEHLRKPSTNRTKTRFCAAMHRADGSPFHRKV